MTCATPALRCEEGVGVHCDIAVLGRDKHLLREIFFGLEVIGGLGKVSVNNLMSRGEVEMEYEIC